MQLKNWEFLKNLGRGQLAKFFCFGEKVKAKGNNLINGNRQYISHKA